MRKITWLRGLIACLLALALAMPVGLAADEREQEELLPLPEDQPGIRILSPSPADQVGEDNMIEVMVEGMMLEHIEVIVSWEGGGESSSGTGDILLTTVQVPDGPGGIVVTARGFAQPGADGTAAMVQDTVMLLSPKQKLIEDMIALAYSNSKDRRYRFARAQDDSDIGICKNFVMRLFDTYKDAYRMQEYPDLELHMPLNRRLVDCKPYQYGIEWAIEGPEDGSPFEVAAMFRYDDELSKEENQAKAREFLLNVKRGDFYQMVGNYVDGNGPHSLLMIADYDPATDLLRWTDSNMKGTRIDGVRWGYIQYDCQKTVDWMVKAICMKNRGATLYRLRDDLMFI